MPPITISLDSDDEEPPESRLPPRGNGTSRECAFELSDDEDTTATSALNTVFGGCIWYRHRINRQIFVHFGCTFPRRPWRFLSWRPRSRSRGCEI